MLKEPVPSFESPSVLNDEKPPALKVNVPSLNSKIQKETKKFDLRVTRSQPTKMILSKNTHALLPGFDTAAIANNGFLAGLKNFK